MATQFNRTAHPWISSDATALGAARRYKDASGLRFGLGLAFLLSLLLWLVLATLLSAVI